MITILKDESGKNPRVSILLADLIAASGEVESIKQGDNAVTLILEELTEQLEVLEDLIDATNYGDDGRRHYCSAGERSNWTAQPAGPPFSRPLQD